MLANRAIRPRMKKYYASFETRSSPDVLAVTRHGFAFYVADHISSIHHREEEQSTDCPPSPRLRRGQAQIRTDFQRRLLQSICRFCAWISASFVSSMVRLYFSDAGAW